MPKHLMLITVDSKGVISPIVEESIKPDLKEEKGYIHAEMVTQGFTLAGQHFIEALETNKVQKTLKRLGSLKVKFAKESFRHLSRIDMGFSGVSTSTVSLKTVRTLLHAITLKRSFKQKGHQERTYFLKIACNDGSRKDRRLLHKSYKQNTAKQQYHLTE